MPPANESLRGWLSVLIAVVVILLVAVGLAFLWNLRLARTGPFGLGLLVALAAFWLAGVLSTWIWTARWRTLGREGPPWRFVFGPRPSHDLERSAWAWGRRAWIFWVAVMVSVLAVAVMLSRESP